MYPHCSLKVHINMTELIIFVSTLRGGGAERVAVQLANNLPPRISRKLITVYATESAYPVCELPIFLCSHHSARILRVVTLPLIFLRYLHLVHYLKPKVVISILPLENLLNIFGSTIMQTVQIVCVHGMPSNTYSTFDSILKKILYLLSKYYPVKIVAVSHGVKNELIEIYRVPSEKISVIYNPIDIAAVSTLALEPVKELIFDSNNPTLITAGRLNNVKGQWHLIRAFAELRRRCRCRLIICGVGPEDTYLINLAAELHISDDVIFLGWCNNPYKYMSKSTVFVQSSLSEALPNVLVEALACGCPVVAANCSSGIEEILGSDNTCGFLAEKMTGIRHTADEPLDFGEQSLLFYMKKILNDPDLRESMSKAGKERAKLFDMEVGIRKYTELIEELSKKA